MSGLGHQVPAGSGPTDGGGGVEQVAGLVSGQPGKAGVGADVAVGEVLAGPWSAVGHEHGAAGAVADAPGSIRPGIRPILRRSPVPEFLNVRGMAEIGETGSDGCQVVVNRSR